MKKYIITTKAEKAQAFTMIDPATGLIEIRTVESARLDLVANQVELALLTRYPLPSKVMTYTAVEYGQLIAK